jgi:uncharacterized protein
VASFEWEEFKNNINVEKHGVSFQFAQHAFLDLRRVIVEDLDHSEVEKRYFCIGCIEDEILTVRFTWRDNTIRIFGAGYWRKGKQIYEKQN